MPTRSPPLGHPAERRARVLPDMRENAHSGSICENRVPETTQKAITVDKKVVT